MTTGKSLSFPEPMHMPVLMETISPLKCYLKALDKGQSVRATASLTAHLAAAAAAATYLAVGTGAVAKAFGSTHLDSRAHLGWPACCSQRITPRLARVT